MEKLELLMGEFLERVERCFTSERRLSFVIVKPDDPEHEHTIVFGSLRPDDLRSVANCHLLHVIYADAEVDRLEGVDHG